MICRAQLTELRSEGLQSVRSVVFAFKCYSLQTKRKENSQQRPLHLWLELIAPYTLGWGRSQRTRLVSGWPQRATPFPNLLAQMIAFSTPVDTVTNIAIWKVEAAAVGGGGGGRSGEKGTAEADLRRAEAEESHPQQEASIWPLMWHVGQF